MDINNLIAVSGGFDPIHVGHIGMLRDAAQYGDVIVILNTDDWLIRKKGFVFMPWEERAEILKSIKYVSSIIAAIDDDDTVCDSLRIVAPELFGNGGDRKVNNTPECKLCEELEIKMIFGLGGSKIQSSSDLVNKMRS